MSEAIEKLAEMAGARRPFQVSDEMLKEIENEATQGLEAPHDPIGSRPRLGITQRREIHRVDSGGVVSSTAHDHSALSEASSTAALLEVRSQTHGDFTDNAAVMQALKRVIWARPGWDRLSDVQREALEMILHKVGRIINGNPDTKDHWDDIAGYAKLASDRIVEG